MGINVEHISKSYHVVRREKGLLGSVKQFFHPHYTIINAVKDISFNIETGKIVGFIGENGAGKSTTIKMMVGILTPDRGTIRINDEMVGVNKKKIAYQIGVVFGQRTQLWWDIPIIESFRLFKDMYRIPDQEYKENLDIFQEILGLNEFMNQPTRHLSLGQRMRADLCAALLHNPSVLFLDEPTIGIDVATKEKMRNFIREINRRKSTTVLLTTHDMKDIEELSDELIVIDRGGLIYQGNLQNLKNRYGGMSTITLKCCPETAGEIQKSVSSKEINCRYDDALYLVFDKKKYSAQEVLRDMVNQFTFSDMQVEDSCLEDIVKKIYYEIDNGGCI